MNHYLKLLIPTVLCTAWCGACVWYARPYISAGRELVSYRQVGQTHYLPRFNATTLRPTNEERVAMVEGMDSLVTWKLRIEPLDSRSPDATGPVQLQFEVREKGKAPIVLFRDIHAYVESARNKESFPFLISMRPRNGSIAKAKKIEFRVARPGVASSQIVDNPFRMTQPIPYGMSTDIAPGTYAAQSSQSVPLCKFIYGKEVLNQERILFLTIRRLPKSYFGG